MSVGLARLVLVTLGCGATVACAQPREERSDAPRCNVNVIVALQPSPDAALIADLSRVSGARLELVRTMTSNLHLFSLTATGPEAECTAAIERLRRDSRVRAVDLDERRRIQPP